MCMSILDRLFGGGSNDDGNCCDMQIEEVEAEDADESGESDETEDVSDADGSNENASGGIPDRTER